MWPHLRSRENFEDDSGPFSMRWHKEASRLSRNIDSVEAFLGLHDVLSVKFSHGQLSSWIIYILLASGSPEVCSRHAPLPLGTAIC